MAGKPQHLWRFLVVKKEDKSKTPVDFYTRASSETMAMNRMITFAAAFSHKFAVASSCPQLARQYAGYLDDEAKSDRFNFFSTKTLVNNK